MAAVKTVKLPSPGPNEQGPTPTHTWIEQERPEVDYPGAIPNTRDPRDNAKDTRLDPAEQYPGSQVPGAPWKSPPAPPPRRLRRDQVMRTDEAKRALEVTERMHALASSPEGTLLTLVEFERLAEEHVAEERVARETQGGGPQP